MGYSILSNGPKNVKNVIQMAVKWQRYFSETKKNISSLYSHIPVRDTLELHQLAQDAA